MFSFAKKPLNLIGILRDGFNLYKTSFTSIWRWQLLWLLPMVFLPASSSLNTTGTMNVLTTPLNTPSFSWLMILYSIVVLLITIYGEIFILSRIYNIGTQKPLNAGASLRLAKDKFLPILGGYVITWLILLALFIVAGLIFGLIYFLISLVSSGHSGYSLIIMMTTLMIVIGVFLVILMFFFNLFILLENTKIVQAIKASVQLVWGNWWRTFAVILVPAVVIFLLVQIVNFLVGLVMPRVYVANNIANLCLLTFLYPWFSSVILVQFNDLKLRRLNSQPK
ncbi:MAG TPA: hypothetical protein VHE99_05695 [Gammaproteobacteria bacterium]|nr:hypothetical protein [Gammaproteobacteria bacterium]